MYQELLMFLHHSIGILDRMAYNGLFSRLFVITFQNNTIRRVIRLHFYLLRDENKKIIS